MHVDEWITRKSFDAVVLTGNGRTEVRIVKAIGEKLNGRYQLAFLIIPINGKKRIGLSIIKSIFIIAEKYGVRKFVIFVDKEHVTKINDVARYIKKGCFLKGLKEIRKNILYKFQIRCTNAKNFILEVIIGINGITKRIEENRSLFIKLFFNQNVPADKKAIMNFYRKRRIHEGQAIIQASNEIVASAFPAIYYGLKLIHANE